MVPIFVLGLISQFIVLALSATLPESNSSNVIPHKPFYSELPDPEQVEAAANAMFAEYWEITLREYPETATVLGDTRYDDRLTRYSFSCLEKRKVIYTEFLERANQLLPQAMEGSETEINLELFITNLQFKLNAIRDGSEAFPLSLMSTPQMNLLFLVKYTKLNTSRSYWNLLSRYRAFPTQIDEMIELMRDGIRINYTLHNVSMITNHDQWDQTAAESPFYQPFMNISQSVPPEERTCLQRNATDIIDNYLTPSFFKLADFLNNEYAPHTRKEIGVGSLPNGRSYYETELAGHLSDTEVTPEEVHELGVKEVARIAKEMETVIQQLGLNLTRKEFINQLRQNKSMFFDSEEEALATYRHTLKAVIPPKLSQLFKFIPNKELAVEKVPPELATGPQAFYMIPSTDNSTPGTFYLDTSNLGNLPRYDVMTLSLHEGVPGHHFQLSYSMVQTGFPEFRKHDIRSNAYLEGWALYAEYLGYELNLYEDPYMLFGHLSQEIFRACRLVVDTGMHVLGWSQQRAIDYMMEYSAAAQDNIEKEIVRYITWPGQACSYKYGELKIKALRKKAEDALGEFFDVKKFHDVVLKMNGPLQQVAKQVDRYIRSMELS